MIRFLILCSVHRGDFLRVPRFPELRYFFGLEVLGIEAFELGDFAALSEEAFYKVSFLIFLRLVLRGDSGFVSLAFLPYGKILLRQNMFCCGRGGCRP